MQTLSRITMVIALGFMPALAQSRQSEWIDVPIPRQVSTEQKLSEPPSGWQSFDNASGKCPANVTHRLTGVQVFDGNPSECVDLVPDSTQELKSKKKLINSWEISSAEKRGTWILCSYYATRMSVCLQLPPVVKEIRITYSTEFPNHPLASKVEYR